MMQHNINVSAHRRIPNRTGHDHALLITRQAQAWTDFVLEHARMQPATVHRKAMDAVAFTLEMKARSFAVPSKLASTSRYQDALAMLDELNPLRGHRLSMQVEDEHIVVAFTDVVLGRVQDKHVPWLRLLLAFGATAHLLTVTGTDRKEGFLGCNVAFAHVHPAMERLKSSGDGSSASVPEVAEDVYLWRDKQGFACTNVAHVVQHSPTGIEWGYSGSGPADLARSILLRFTDPDTADRLYQKFKADVIATVPHEGGLIRAAFVVSWLYAHGA